MAAQAGAGDQVADTLTRTDGRSDPRVVVVAFDTVVDGAVTDEVAFRRATFMKEIVVAAGRGGALAVGLLDFDSSAFSDGASGVTNIVASDDVQRLAVIPLHDVAIDESANGLPIMTRFRVDELATDVAGIGVGQPNGVGVVRRVPALVRVGDIVSGADVEVPEFMLDDYEEQATNLAVGFSLRLYSMAADADPRNPSASGVTVGDQHIPLENGSLRIRWSDDLSGSGAGRVIPAERLYEVLTTDLFRGAVVLVGTMDPAKSPYVSTPVGDLPPLLVEANALNTLLTHRYVRPAPTWPSTSLAVVLGLLVVVPAGTRRRERWSIALLAVVGVAWIAVAVAVATQRPVAVLVVPVTAAAAVASRVLLRHVSARAERIRVRHLFRQYMPDYVARQLLDSGGERSALEGQRQIVTALFVDIRSFTPLAARLEPSQIRVLLNEFYGRIGAAVFAEGGTVVQYVGDEVFAVFGAPLPMKAHAVVALRCARAMFADLDDLQIALAAEGLPPINFGIGLHSGEVVAANVGSPARMQYSVIGDAVNMASRHAALAEPGEIILSAATADLVETFDGRVDAASLKGIGDTMRVVRLRVGPEFASGDRRLVSD